jgi:hypothetical protein
MATVVWTGHHSEAAGQSRLRLTRLAPAGVSLFHAVAAAWIAAMLWMGRVAPESYRELLQEDRIIEWGTVWLFLAAGFFGLYHAARSRRLFDGLVALFCLFIAGEEFSWGQRLFGYYAPEFFLSNNFQQEVNLHNLAQAFLQPKWVLMMALAGYGLLLPLMVRRGYGAAWMDRLGATPPPMVLVPWFAIAIILLLWYPLTLTGEWVEAFAGGLFVASMRPGPKTFWTIVALAVVFGGTMTAATDRLEHGRDASRVTCASSEVRGLVDDVAGGDAGTARLWRMGRVHKRVWTSVTERYLDADGLRRFRTVLCDGPSADSAELRHTYGVDPWGSPYWLLFEKNHDGRQRVSVYSFGPNRRRDLSGPEAELVKAGDDILVTGLRRVQP